MLRSIGISIKFTRHNDAPRIQADNALNPNRY